MQLPLCAFVVLLLFQYSYGANLGETCDTSTNTCTDINTYCAIQSACTKGICTCNSGYAAYAGVCVHERLIGDYCSSTYCTYGTCTNDVCSCTSGQTVSSDRRSCVGKKLGESCSVSSDCQGYGAGTVTCSGSTCTCVTGYKAYNDYVCTYYEDGETCTSGTTVCSPVNAQCDSTSKTCICSTVSGTKYSWYEFSRAGNTLGACVHPSSTKNVAYGQSCTVLKTDSTAKFCANDLVCSLCPEESLTSTNYKCLNGVAQLRAASYLTVLVLLLSIRKFF